MPKRKTQLNGKGESFGERLARLIQEAGLSQRDLAAVGNMSQRMVAYYEKQSTPLSHTQGVQFPSLAHRIYLNSHISQQQLSANRTRPKISLTLLLRP